MTIGQDESEERLEKQKTFAGRGASVLKITEAGMMADNTPQKSPGQHAGKTSASSLAFGDGGFMCRPNEEVRPAKAKITSEAQLVSPGPVLSFPFDQGRASLLFPLSPMSLR
jgi:hypothetical protein